MVRVHFISYGPLFHTNSVHSMVSRFPSNPTMQNLLHFRIQPLFPNPHHNAGNPSSSSSFRYFPLPNRPRIRAPIICAKYSRRRPSGPRKSSTSILRLAPFVASNFNFLPEPWNSMVRQVGGGGNLGGPGGGSGFGGWGGFDGWGWGRRRGRKGKLGVLGFMMAIGLVLWVCLGKEMELDVFFEGLYLGLYVGLYLGLCLSLGLAMANRWNKQSSEMKFGFCFGAAVGGLWMMKEELQKWVKEGDRKKK